MNDDAHMADTVRRKISANASDDFTISARLPLSIGVLIGSRLSAVVMPRLSSVKTALSAVERFDELRPPFICLAAATASVEKGLTFTTAFCRGFITAPDIVISNGKRVTRSRPPLASIVNG